MAQQYGMGLSISQSMKQTQRLIMTPQMQQSIQLLQMNSMELEQMAEQEMLENPFLELNVTESDPSDGADEAGDAERDALDTRDADEANPTGTEPDAATSSESDEKSAKDNDSNDESDFEQARDDVIESSEDLSESNFDEVDTDWDAIYDGNEAPLTRVASTREAPEEETDFAEYTAQKVSLLDHLEWQIETAVLEDHLLPIGQYLINNINDDGYLIAPGEEDVNRASILTQDPDEVIRRFAEELQVDEEDVRHVLGVIQSFDPAGVGARNLAECLLIQLDDRGEKDTLCRRMLEEEFDLFINRKFKPLAKALGVTEKEIHGAYAIIAHLEPRPGRMYSTESPHYIRPDVYVKEMDGKYVYYLREGDVGRLKINDYYRNLLANNIATMTDKEREYAMEKYKSALWLLKNIEKRKSTILSVTESIMEYQKDFLDKGVEHLRPLILKTIAEEVGMHESTIARVTNSKYVETPRGTFSLKYFFSSSLGSGDGGEDASSRSVKAMIREIVDNEDPKKPLSDEKISAMLSERNVQIARRTVNKYRKQLKILPAKMRKTT